MKARLVGIAPGLWVMVANVLSAQGREPIGADDGVLALEVVHRKDIRK